MTPTSNERDTRIPYRLGTDHYCTYEDDGSYVRIGDMISHFYETPFSEVGIGGVVSVRYVGVEIDGELCSVRYGEDGFIDAVSVYVEGEEMNFDCPCDGVFYRMKAAHDADQ